MQTFELSGPMTVFAPVNEAFERLSNQTIANLTDDPHLLEQLIMYHVVPNKKIIINDLEDEDMVLKSVVGDPLRLNTYLRSQFYQVLLSSHLNNQTFWIC